MHWILQTNLFNEREWTTLVETLERFGLPYSVHKVVPFVGELIPEPAPTQEKVICFGSYSMRHSAKKFGWNPGVYDLFDVNFNRQMAGSWRHKLLNSDSRVCAFKDLNIDGPTFIRPIDDSKYFAGRVFEPEEFYDWKRKVVVLEHDYGNSLTGETMLQACAPKTIFQEVRYWIVDGKIATRSMYKIGTRVHYSDQVDERFDHFAMTCINPLYSGWCPHKAFVLDICDTPDGMRIVEINTINAAGFYAADIPKLVMALEEMEAAE